MSSTAPSSSLPSGTSSSSPPVRSMPPRGNQNNFPPGTAPELTSSASLYLYTFLATLVLLLVVSGTIIARTWVLRRRQRAAIAQAIANGTFAPGSRAGPPERPTMYDVHIGQGDAQTRTAEEGRAPTEKVDEKEKGRARADVGAVVVDWDKMVPLSCRWTNPPPPAEQAEEEPASPTAAPATTPIPPPSPRSRWLRWLRRRPREPLLPTTQTAPSESTPASPTTTMGRTSRVRNSVYSTEKPPLTPEPLPETVRVSVLISMPFADMGRRTTGDEAEPELPYMEFGVTEVSADGLGAVLASPATPAPSAPPAPARTPVTQRSQASLRSRGTGPS
ncbi:hypothetical protein C8Q76DRAFT_739318 [Earliella scabrosa]|nr:hypothetical protein C8Q76DRAFT_739318 [Earliella scabrosa]